MDLLTAIRAAHRAIRPHVPVTPLVRSAGLSERTGCDVWLKCEHLMPTGSFKLRGAVNAVRQAGGRGVVTASTGNHGQAMAMAGGLFGVPVTVVVAAGAAPGKLAAIRQLGARLVVVEGPTLGAELAARRLGAAEGLDYVSPYNDSRVVAGQGTLGMELVAQRPELDAVFVAVGGGGLAGGIGTALRGAGAGAGVVGCWPAASPSLLHAMAAGRVVPVAEADTLSDGTAGAIEEGALTVALCRTVIDETVEVTEAEIAAGLRLVAECDQWMVEGAAGVAVAGLLRRAAAYRGRSVAVVLCGRNIGLPLWLEAVARVR